MHFFAVSSLLVGISSLSMAIWVYLKGRTEKINIAWAFLALSISIWGFGGYKFTSTLNREDAFLWLRLTYVGIIFMPPLLCQFIYELLGIKRKKRIVVLYLLSIVFVIINFVSKSLFLGEPGIIFSSFYWVVSPGPILYLFISYFFGMVVYSLYKLFKGYRTSSGLKQNQIKYFYFAALIGFSSGTSCFLPCFGINFYPGIGNLGVALYWIPMTYAIVKYRLMDIRVVITRTGVFVAVYTLVLGIPFIIANWFKNCLIRIFGVNWWMLPLGLMAVLATAGPFIYIFLNRKAEKRLLHEQLRYQATLKQAAREIARIHSLKRLLSLIVHIVTKTVGISHAAIYLYDEKNEQFILKAGRNITGEQSASTHKESPLVKWLKEHKESLVYDEIKLRAEDRHGLVLKELEEEMRFLHASVIVPGFLDNKLLGFLMLGDKRSGRIYTTEDLNTFSVLASQAALAIENALLYENIEEQVRQRTKELVEVQKQLIQAEKLATVGTLAGGVAHEINNPLTAILTNVQMLLASNPIDATMDRESLELIEEATKRCRTIVQKLMAYAKKPLETAEVSEVNLLNVLKNAVSFLGYQLEQENIKIIIEAKENDYLVMGNQNELEQVVTNIVLNARDAIKRIKKSGDIHISLLKSGDWIKIIIKDEGMGIPKEIISKIFDPFFTTKEVGKGTGLGLSICQAIVEKHNGLITVQSELNKGSVFTVQLPKVKLRNKIKSEAGIP